MKLFKKEGSKYWWYDFTVRGERFRGSTKETNESRARKIAALKFAEACENSDPLPKKAPTLRQVSKRFLEWVDSARIEPKTKTYYNDGWRLLSTTPILGLRLDAINNDVAERLVFSGSAANTNCALRTLRRILHKAEEWKLIRRASKIRLLPEKERTLRLDDEAERRLLAGAAECDWRPPIFELFRDVVILIRDTGMRNEKELYQVRIENINWDRQTRSGVDHGRKAGCFLPSVPLQGTSQQWPAGFARHARRQACPRAWCSTAAAMTSARAC